MTIPAGTLEGGEIYTKELPSFGTHEVRMKLPLAPSSITGFFLYTEPDFFNEIEIEIHNSKNRKFLLTTYEGEKSGMNIQAHWFLTRQQISTIIK